MTLTQDLPGRPIRLLTIGGRLCAITIKDGRPRFTVLTAGLEIWSTGPTTPSFPEVKGAFYGALTPSADSYMMSSTLKLNLNGRGRASGTLSVGGKVIPFRIALMTLGMPRPSSW
jgi:hypothetical protein